MTRGVRGSRIPLDPKTCTGCLQAKPLSGFNRDSSRIDGYYNRCRDCRQIELRALTPEAIRNYKLITTYGITQVQWDWAFLMQGRCCALCRGSSPRSKNGWFTDHDHATGKVRGILCYRCNALIGYMENGWINPDPALAQAYLDDPPFPHHMAALEEQTVDQLPTT